MISGNIDCWELQFSRPGKICIFNCTANLPSIGNSILYLVKEINLLFMMYAGMEKQVVEGIPWEAEELECPDLELREKVLQEFLMLDEKYLERLRDLDHRHADMLTWVHMAQGWTWRIGPVHKGANHVLILSWLESLILPFVNAKLSQIRLLKCKKGVFWIMIHPESLILRTWKRKALSECNSCMHILEMHATAMRGSICAVGTKYYLTVCRSCSWSVRRFAMLVNTRSSKNVHLLLRQLLQW